MEKEIRDMAETRTAHYLKYLCRHGKYKYRCRECGGSQICPHNRQSKPVKIAEGLKYVGITGKKINAKIVEGLKYAPITDKKLTAKSVKGLKYAPITDKNLTARSVLIRLK